MTSKQRWRAAAGWLLASVVLGLLLFQLVTGLASAGRRVGIAVDDDPGGIVITGVIAGQPADRAGLLKGDVVVRLDGRPVSKISDWDAAAGDFTSSRKVEVSVLRGGQPLTLGLRPGTGFRWLAFLINAFTALAYLAVGVLALVQRGGDLRARLLFLFGTAVAIELALPIYAIGTPILAASALTAFFLITGLEIGFELHLASVIPDRHAWLERRPWVVPLYYLVGLGFGGTAALTLLAEDLLGYDIFPWTGGQAESLLFDLAVPLWAVAVAVLLIVGATRHPRPEGRHQAGLVLAGVLPWAFFALATTPWLFPASVGPSWLDQVESLALLCYPLAVFVAIYRYDLFDIERAVRRSLLYTTLTGASLLVFYAALGAGGAVFSNLVRQDRSVWVVASATLILGLLFSPLRRWLHRGVERRFFPEREAVRRRLVSLAARLPAHGKLPRMGDNLTRSLTEIFSLETAGLLIADPASGVLGLLAANGPGLRPASSDPMLALDDPGVRHLETLGRPLSLQRDRGTLMPLARRLKPLEPAYLLPLLHRDRLVGLLVLGHKQGGGDLSAEEIELLGLMAHHVASVLENARLFESATYESLTGLLRREAILGKLERELERAVRYGRPLTVGLADLDHFKAINDRHGHLVGDGLLRRIADAIRSGLRSADAVGRYGGEEFLLVLPETDLAGAAVVAEKVRTAVASTRLEIDGEADASVTVSIGLASLDEVRRNRPRPTADDLIGSADESLYRAKGAGRNKVHPLLSRVG